MLINNNDLGRKRMEETKELDYQKHLPLEEREEQLVKEEIENTIDINILQEYKSNPFKNYSGEMLQELANSIKLNGLINPIIVWEKDTNYIIISGHNRVKALKILGYTNLAENMYKIMDISEEEANIILVESNLMQREKITFSEKGFAYKIRLEAIKKQGKSREETSVQVGQKLNNDKTSVEIIAESTSTSKNQVQRYIRLTNLITPLLDKVDTETIRFTTGVELSFLKETEQEVVYSYFFSNDKPKNISLKLAKKLKEFSKTDEITYENIESIVAEKEKVKVSKFEISTDELTKTTGIIFENNDEIKDYLLKCIKFYKANNS